MSYVIAAPEFVTAAAADLAGIGSSLGEANAAAAASTTRVITAAEDEVSTAIAAKLTTGYLSPRTRCTTGRRSIRNSVSKGALLEERSAAAES
jgi:hypothetical protein